MVKSQVRLSAVAFLVNLQRWLLRLNSSHLLDSLFQC